MFVRDKEVQFKDVKKLYIRRMEVRRVLEIVPSVIRSLFLQLYF